MVTVELDCRNFDCPLSVEGDCSQKAITLEPVGGIRDRVICVESPRAEEEQPTIVGGRAQRDGGTDPSSR